MEDWIDQSMLRMKCLAVTGVAFYMSILVVLHKEFIQLKGPALLFGNTLNEIHTVQLPYELRKSLTNDSAPVPISSKQRPSNPVPISSKQRPSNPVTISSKQRPSNHRSLLNGLTTLVRASTMLSAPAFPQQVLKEWSTMLKSVIPEELLQKIQSGDPHHSLSQLEQSPRLMKYAPFHFTLPNLESEADAKLFKLNKANRDELGSHTEPEKLTGKINILSNVIVIDENDCGYKTKDEYFYSQVPAVTLNDDSILVPLLVPDSHAFQHFIDGLLPKLMQALDLLLLPGVKLLMFEPRDSIIYDMLEELGISRDKLVFYGAHPIRLKKIINSCVTPPLHPVLWSTARRLLKVPDQLPSLNNTFVILVTRAGSHNGGRKMLNFEEIKNVLSSRYGSRLVIFMAGLNLNGTRSLFARAAIIVGVHGGALYNLMFAPQTTHIIEFYPLLLPEGDPLPGLAHQIFWMQTQLIGQPYWRMHLTPQLEGDVNVPITRLTAVLDKVDAALKMSVKRAQGPS